MHPYMTEQLVRDRRAALDAEAHGERLVRPVETRAKAHGGRRRITLTARTFARRVRGLVARSA
jgi:hypothetical protein